MSLWGLLCICRITQGGKGEALSNIKSLSNGNISFLAKTVMLFVCELITCEILAVKMKGEKEDTVYVGIKTSRCVLFLVLLS